MVDLLDPLPARQCPHLCTGRSDEGVSISRRPHPHRACIHLIAPAPLDLHCHFHAEDASHDLLCEGCSASAPPAQELYELCQACWRAMMRDHNWDENRGAPTSLAPLCDELVPTQLMTFAPAPAPLWDIVALTARQRKQLGTIAIALTQDLELLALSPPSEGTEHAHAWQVIGRVDAADLPGKEGADEPPRPFMTLSPSGRFVFIAQQRGSHAVLHRLDDAHDDDDDNSSLIKVFTRGEYCVEHCQYPVVFCERDGIELLVTSSNWNRMDVYDASSGALLTARDLHEDDEDDDKSRALDYFYCALYVTRDANWLLNTGWCWHPVGVVSLWSLDAWLGGNLYESDDGPSRKDPADLVTDDWDKPVVALEGAHVAFWGIWHQSDAHLPGVMIMDAASGDLIDVIGLHRGDCLDLSFTGRHIVVHHEGGALSLIDPREGRCVRELSVLAACTHVEEDLYLVGAMSESMSIWKIY